MVIPCTKTINTDPCNTSNCFYPLTILAQGVLSSSVSWHAATHDDDDHHDDDGDDGENHDDGDGDNDHDDEDHHDGDDDDDDDDDEDHDGDDGENHDGEGNNDHDDGNEDHHDGDGDDDGDDDGDSVVYICHFLVWDQAEQIDDSLVQEVAYIALKCIVGSHLFVVQATVLVCQLGDLEQ